MARTKRTRRDIPERLRLAPRLHLAGSTPPPKCQWPACLALDDYEPFELPPSPPRHTEQPAGHAKDPASPRELATSFPQFRKLPAEIQLLIFEFIASEPRVVPIYAKRGFYGYGLRSPVGPPPILHVCSQSRAIGLKHYTLAFGSVPYRSPSGEEWTLPRTIYFNFERDVFYLRQRWNEHVAGPYRCVERLHDLLEEGVLRKVRKAGIDVGTRVCGLEDSGARSHRVCLAGWDALEVLYVGYEGERDQELGHDCPITFAELESKDYGAFMREWNTNPCWEHMHDTDDGEAIRRLRTEEPISYQSRWGGGGNEPEGFLTKLEPVRMKHL